MGSESNINHSDNLRSSIGGIINLRTLVVWSRRPLVLLSCQLVVELPVVELPSCPLVTSPSCLLALPLFILSLHRPLIFSLRRLVVVASPLVAPPSCSLGMIFDFLPKGKVMVTMMEYIKNITHQGLPGGDRRNEDVPCRGPSVHSERPIPGKGVAGRTGNGIPSYNSFCS